MKKRISMSGNLVFFFVLCLFLAFAKLEYLQAATDTTAPEVKSILLNQSEAREGETISVTLDLLEEETGITKIEVVLRMKNNCHIIISKDCSADPLYTGKVEVTDKVYSSYTSGTYQISHVLVIDQAGNSRGYGRGTPDQNDSQGIYLYSGMNESDHCYINGSGSLVINTSTVFAPPIVNTINMKTSSAKNGEDIQFELQVPNAENIECSMISILLDYCSDGVAGNVTRNVTLENISIISCSGDKIIFSTAILDNMQSGDYELSGITIYNQQGQVTCYNKLISGSYGIEGDQIYLRGRDDYDRCYLAGNHLVNVSSFTDHEYPKLQSIKIREEKIKKPGIIHVDFTVSDNIELSSIMVDLVLSDSSFSYTPDVSFERGTKSYSGTLEIPVSTSDKNGDYYFGQIIVSDRGGNELRVNDVDGMVTIEDEFDVSFDLGLNNNKLLDCVKKLQVGETGRINIKSSYRKARKELFEAIQGKDVNLLFASDYYRWVFNGKDIVSPKDIDLNISLAVVKGTDYGSDENLLEVTFADNGKLPGIANVRFKSDYIKNIFSLTENCYLYYENEAQNQLELQTSSNIHQIIDGTDHWCDFRISHNSKFLCSGKKLSKLSMKQEKKTTKKKAPPRGTVLKDQKTGNKYKVLVKGKQVAFCGTKKQTKVVMPATISIDGFKYKVTAISANAMKNNKTVRTVTIGKQVKTIGKNAFLGCIKLAKVSGAKSVTKIKSGAFSGCKKLTSVALGGNLTEIGEKAFYNCSALQKVTIPVKVCKIGKSAFYGCKKLKTISIKSSKLTAAKVGKNAFKGIYKKAVINVPKKKLKAYTTFLKKRGIGKNVKITA